MVKKILFALILCGGLVLRFNQLGINPPSLDWDEVSAGYNAYSLLYTGHDEYGYAWPISIRSFGDFKPPLYTYLTIPAVALFGLTEFAVRLPSAIFGTLTLVAVYFLTKEFFRKNSTKSGAQAYNHENLALLAMAIFAIEIGRAHV